MDKVPQNTSTGSSSAPLNTPHSATNYGVPNAPSMSSAVRVSGLPGPTRSIDPPSSTSQTQQLGPLTSSVVGPSQLARPGESIRDVTMSTSAQEPWMTGPSRQEQQQQQFLNHSAPVGVPQNASSSAVSSRTHLQQPPPAHGSTVATHAPIRESLAKLDRPTSRPLTKSGPGWTVPNPLLPSCPTGNPLTAQPNGQPSQQLQQQHHTHQNHAHNPPTMRPVRSHVTARPMATSSNSLAAQRVSREVASSTTHLQQPVQQQRLQQPVQQQRLPQQVQQQRLQQSVQQQQQIQQSVQRQRMQQSVQQQRMQQQPMQQQRLQQSVQQQRLQQSVQQQRLQQSVQQHRLQQPVQQQRLQQPVQQQRLQQPVQQQRLQQPVQQQGLQQPVKKTKVVLSPEAKQALAKAIWSAIRSPEGTISKELMDAALATGLPKHAILNAARVAREREAMKRQAMQQQQQLLQKQQRPQHQQKPMPPKTYQQQRKPTIVPTVTKPSVPITLTVSGAPTNKAFAQAVPSKPLVVTKPKLPTPSSVASQQALTGKMVQDRLEERSKWKRVHSGVFMKQKGRFLALSHSVSALVRSTSVQPAIKPNISKKDPSCGRKRPRSEILADASRIQELLRNTAVVASPVSLLDPEKFKRVKIEPKKYAKALDRAVRKGRQAAAEQLSKQHKELSKAIASHQQEFFKFHRQRKTEAYRIAKAIRDTLDKEERKKEKDAAAAERARLAALKANDMDAYSKLLEETKNDRLKFLMDKTERHFSQISTSLLQTRNKDGSVQSSGGTGSYYASAHLKTEEVRQPSILVGGDLKEYQLSGLQWLVSLYNNKLNGILADEMGLGKTIQAISLVAYLMEFKNNLGPYLVIVPLSTLSNWANEFSKWCPSAHTICYKGTPSQRKDLYKHQVRTGHFNVLLTTYEYIIKDKASLRKITWQYAIVDEGHRMKNAASKFAKTLSTQYTTKYRLLLTGTPLMNDLSELWSLLNFLLPAIFNSVETFDQWFNRPFAQFGNTSGSAEEEANFLSNEERMFIIHRLHELLRPFMLRRVKSEVLDQLPEKVEKILRCELSSWQKELYKQISAKAVAENSVLGTGYVQPQAASRGLNNVVMQLRKVCNHPYLFSPEGYRMNENIIRSSGKIELLDRMLPKLRAAGHRVLMFTQMTAVMTILEDYFAYRGYLSLRLDGSTPAEEREKRMYKFNAPDSPYFVFLLSTRAGGLGLNLTAADTVIIFDSDWNPMMDLQAQDRAHRIGQRSDVSVFRLVTYTPVEEKILSRATEKLNMSELVVEAGKFDKRSVESDNSLERKKMMEVLLTDFDTSTTNATSQEKTTSELTGSASGDEDNDEDNDGSETSDKDDLNDLLSNNESDYQLYDAMDDQRARDTSAVDVSLFCDPDDLPDWIKYPSGKKNGALQSESNVGNGSRKRKEVMYDDGLTEKQFLRLMEKQADGEDAAREQARAARRAKAESSALENDGSDGVAASSSGSDLTDWTFRKLISCTKAVIALKDPSTKRRLCEIFLEKPAPEQYPDYYELIEKPIAINDILRKLRGKLYANLFEFRDDWKLMFTNAKTFNGDGSWVVEDGKALEKELDRVLKKNGFNEETPKPRPTTPKKKLRIKLSLKTLKAREEAAVPDEENDETSETEAEVSERVPSRGRRARKRRKMK